MFGYFGKVVNYFLSYDTVQISQKKKKISSTVHFFLRSFPVYVGSIYRKSMYTRFTSGAFTLEFLFLFFSFVFLRKGEGRSLGKQWLHPRLLAHSANIANTTWTNLQNKKKKQKTTKNCAILSLHLLQCDGGTENERLWEYGVVSCFLFFSKIKASRPELTDHTG